MIKVIKDFSPVTIKLESLDDLKNFTWMLSDYIVNWLLWQIFLYLLSIPDLSI